MAFNVNCTVSGLSTSSFVIPTAAQTFIEGTITLPSISQGDGTASSCVATVTRTPSGGSPSTIYTGSAGARGFELMYPCAALDTITIALTSSAAVDQGLNVIKTTISIG